MDASILKVVFLLIIKLVTCQVCNETRSIFREVPETFRFSYIETYKETDCVIFCSVKTRNAVSVSTRIVQRYENITINICCEGYVEDDSQEGNGLYCQPNCNPPCRNGFCRRPNECACNAGYALDPLDSHTCKPLCLQDCDISDCISTRILQCPSYETELSSPVCEEPCVNATCTAPEVCECFPGFYKTSASVCEPSEYLYCRHGKYLRDRCLCDIGYKWICGECQPICSNCEHGLCQSPEECQCEFGYTESDNGKCEPYCSYGCSNGTCISPEVCRCNPGWYMVEEGGLCMPHCDMNCDNGECVAPNVCECDSGYEVGANEPRCVLTQLKKDCEDLSEMCTTEDDQETTTEIREEAVKNIKIPDVNAILEQEIDESTSRHTTKEKSEVRTAFNSENRLKSPKIFGLSTYWIYGIGVVAVLIILVILGIIINRCSRSKTSADKTDDVVVRYVKKTFF